mgnify:CR=1 FL=1|tara:strand:+ start:284 stop:592 length:309 start_codon:yes stop_codon:yes gene_type:complete
MANGNKKLTVQEAQNIQLGQAGYVYLDEAGTDNTGTTAGVEYVAVTVLESASSACNIATESSDTTLFPDTTFANLTAGTTIYGRWKKVTVSGSNCCVIAYKG